MMGQDCERMVKGIEAVRQATQSAIESFSSAAAYRITIVGSEEKEVPAGDVMSGITSAMGSLSSDCGKMDSLNKGHYTSTSKFLNGISSPWNELSKLSSAVDAATSYSGSNSPFKYLGEKVGMLSMLNMILSCAIDAKWAVITYNDYIQRGFDAKYNGGESSVKFKTGLNKVTNGNLPQSGGNANVKAPSSDAF